MLIEIHEIDGVRFQLFIDGVCMSSAHKNEADCYKEYIMEITKQKGILEFEDFPI